MLKHKCGIFGLYSKNNHNNKNIIVNTIKGLENLQHRGRESAGISYINEDGEITIYKNFGLVKDIFLQEHYHNPTLSCIGHVRYSTTKKQNDANKDDEFKLIQPLWGECNLGEFSIVHNGNIPNVEEIIKKYKITLETTSDSEIFVQLLKKTTFNNWEDKIIYLVDTIPGIYSLIIQTRNSIYGIKDRYGMRPLCFAKNSNYSCFSSESSYLANCTYVKELECGEIIKLDNNGDRTIYIKDNCMPKFCVFEIIYFMKHTSIIHNKMIETYRYAFGQQLGYAEDIINYGAKNTFVADIPNTAIPSAKGYAHSLNIKYLPIFEKKDGTGRTFILPTNKQRYTTNRIGLQIKDNINVDKYSSIILVDDSLVRGNTIKNIIKKVKEYGFTTIHLRISSPPIKHPCYYGIDIPTKEELIANNRTPEEIAHVLGISSLRYLHYEDMSSIFNHKICGECFTGNRILSL
tara:strand:- start:199 stop:1581 length:1383 start_codon:yes stop_codon:yes gene_type:complete